jgi:hypothetical protein
MAHEVGVCDLAVGGDGRLLNEEDGPSAGDLFMARALLADAVGEEASPFVGEATGPDECVGANKELLEGVLLAGSRWSGGECGDVVGVAQEGDGLGEVLYDDEAAW